MPFIDPADGHLTVFNIFETEDLDRQGQVLDAMRDIIDGASAYPGWRSSTLHAAVDHPGTANYIQWRSLEDLENRYAGESFQKRTVPLFHQLSTRVQLLKTEVVFAQRHPGLAATEISPERDDHTVIFVLGVEPGDQAELLENLAKPDDWLLDVPGYRSHTYLRGIDGTYVVNYAQWDSKEHYDRFHTLPESERPADVRQARERSRSLATYRTANTYRVVYTRSATEG